MASVSVIVVSYNTRELLRRCLNSLTEAHEVIVVDNASTDSSAEMVRQDFPTVRLVSNETNVGFGQANNQGLATMTGDLALLLNSDAMAHPKAIPTLSGVFEDPDVVAAGGRLEHPDGRLQLSCANRLTLWAVFCEQALLEKLFPGSRWLSPYWISNRLDKTADVEQVMGACLMLRPVERFDERFFLYAEDTELCLRLRRHGRILYVPEAVFTHELGASGTRWQSIARYNRGKELVFFLHSGPAAGTVCWLLNRSGALLRLLGWGVPCLLTLGAVARLRRQAGLFARVLFAPMRGPADPRVR